jgi:hypothetical protein
MRFLADENFSGNAVAKLEAVGHDIVWVRTAAPVEFCLRSTPWTAASLRQEVVIFVPTPNMKGLRRILKREPLQQPSSLRRYLATYTGVEALSLLMKNIPR